MIKLTAGLYFDKLIQLSVSDSGSWAELAKALPGEDDEGMAPVRASYFTVLINGKQTPVARVQMHKQATLVLEESIPKSAVLSLTYSAPVEDQSTGVLQTSSGEDIPPATLSSPAELFYFQGYRTEVLPGAVMGVDFSREFPEVGVYLDQSRVSTIDEGYAGTVTRVSGSKITVELVATNFANNPLYSPKAPAGSLASYTSTKGKLTLLIEAGSLTYAVGDTFDGSQLGSASKNIRVFSGVQSVLATSTGDSANEFLLYQHTAIGSPVPFWMAIGTWQFNTNGADFNRTETGGGYSDVLISGGGNDSLDGRAGNDTIYGGAGNDTVTAGDGSDLIIGGNGAGDDHYDGGRGVDLIKYISAKSGITVNLAKCTAFSTEGVDSAGIGVDKLKAIENVIAGDYADTLIGSKDVNSIEGGSGNDTIYGGLGSDTLVGGAGADIFVFNTKPDVNNVDTISDFEIAEDKVLLSSKIFSKLAGVSDFLALGEMSDSPTRYLIYDSVIGKLSYDADGSGVKSKPVDVVIIGNKVSLDITNIEVF